MIKYLLFGFSIFFLIILCACESRTAQTPAIQTGDLTLSAKTVDEFPYVVMKKPIESDDPGQALSVFMAEASKQHVVPTGHVFIIFYQVSGKQAPASWEICIPTAEGTIVQEPLRLKTWQYKQVMQTSEVKIRTVGQKLYPWFSDFTNANDLDAQPVIVLRIIDGMNDLALVNNLQSEVWVPMGLNRRTAE